MQRLPLISLLAVPFTAACFNPGAKTDEDLAATNTDTPADSTGDVDSHGDSSPDGGDAPDDSSTTSGSPSDDDSATSDDTTTDSTPDPYCGDGTIDEGEECDDGENNGPGQACRADCQLNVCGDNDQGPDEACDDGPQNALELGACAPDCSRVIEAKEITLGSTVATGNLGQNPVATVDGLCEPGFKALFAHSGVREFTPLTDWALQPYTAYRNATGSLIWITDSTPALGVRDGQHLPLATAISEATVYTTGVITGLNNDWSTRNSNTCNAWSSASETHVAGRGDHMSQTTFLAGATDRSCNELTFTSCGTICLGNWTTVYCVEQ